MKTPVIITFSVMAIFLALSLTLIIESYKENPETFRKNVRMISWITMAIIICVTVLLIALQVHKT